MHFSEEQLKEIEQMAGLFFSPADIADNLQLNAEDSERFIALIEIKDPHVYLPFRRGRLKTEAELRESIKMAAMNGSSPAQGMMIQFYKDSQ